MRKPKTKCKAFSILLCFAMLMSLLPATVYAAQEVTYANIILDKPKAGNIPDWNAEYEGKGFEVTDIKWRENAHNGDYMDYDEPFEAGKSYLVSVIIEPTSGYVISRDQGDSHWIWYIDAYINGNYVSLMSKVGLHDMNDAWEEYLPVELITTFYVPEEITEIDRVEIEGVSIPVPGQNPQFRASTPTKGVKLTDGNYENAQNGVCWYDMDYRMDMGGNDTFEAGHRYRLIVHAETTKGYEFVDYNDWYDAYVNGKPADVDLKKKEVDIIYFFDCKNEVVESVEVEDINAPKDGSLPDYRGTIYDPAVSFKAVNNTFTQNGISWFNVTDNWSMTPNDRFEAGKQYKVSMTLVPSRSEYEFNVSEGYLNGDEGTVTKNGKEVVLEYTFSPLGLNTVSKVEVTGVTAPKAGGFPSYVAVARGDMDLKDVNDKSFKNGIAWYDKTAGKYVPVSGGVFEAGHEYLVELYLVPEKGAAFDGNAKATVNGEKANIVTASKSEFYITYGFAVTDADAEEPAGPVVLEEVGVKNIAEPKAGEAPDYDVDTEDTGYVLSDDKDRDTKNGITWKNETTGKPMLVGIDKFEAGNTYSVSVMLKAEDGYVFDVDDATINGEDAEADGRDETEAILFYEFEKLPAAEEVPVVPEVPVAPEVPVVPETPKKQSNFTDVKAGAYYETPVQWAVENGITSGTSKTEFSPDMTCSQAHILTFLWKSMGKPAANIASPYSNPNVNESKYYYTPFVWAWEKGLVGNVKHDPDAPCSRADVVTYLWKLEGKPDAAKASFTDVLASAEYAKAVDWAVANGITSGTSKTTFSPADTCTRGQIVSFLYRYVNSK